jgi:ABC-type multidrug transport system fused ATPase/permease subunit
MTALVFIKDLIVATFSQMASLFAGVFIFGLLIHFISQFTFKSLERAFGSKGTYFVAWLGTPIHELGHALFCLIFMHKIVEIEFFKPDPLTGTLGYVYHKWNRSNPWQVLGNFFIGIGPVILGSMALLATFYLLIPNSSQVWDAIIARVNEVGINYSAGSYFSILGGSSLAMAKLIFTVPNLTSWRFWVFCYLSICVASNIRLSLSDIKGALSGLGCLIVPFLLINFLVLITNLDGMKFFPLTASSLGAVYSLFTLALIMVLLGFMLTYLVSAAYVKIKYGYPLNPL